MKRYNPRQRTGSEFGGTTPNQNTLQPMDRTSDLSAADQARLIKRTGQTADPNAPARYRNFAGQKGDKPRG